MIDLGLAPATESEFDLNWPLTVKHALRDGAEDGIAPAAVPSARRRTLWEIWDGYHCSICGTCLSFAELRKIAAKAGLCFEPDETEHGIHGHFVQLGSKQGRVSKLRLNGHFIYHDGGIEDHEGQLGRILGQADVVLCPVDCVSHRASLRAKTFCKRTAKPFVPLRSAGLSSFVTGLRRATELNGAGAWTS